MKSLIIALKVNRLARISRMLGSVRLQPENVPQHHSVAPLYVQWNLLC